MDTGPRGPVGFQKRILTGPRDPSKGLIGALAIPLEALAKESLHLPFLRCAEPTCKKG